VAGRTARGVGLIDVVVALALLALLVWLVRLDWRPAGAPSPAAHSSTRSSRTSV
jgi:hypothetical protein